MGIVDDLPRGKPAFDRVRQAILRQARRPDPADVGELDGAVDFDAGRRVQIRLAHNLDRHDIGLFENRPPSAAAGPADAPTNARAATQDVQIEFFFSIVRIVALQVPVAQCGLKLNASRIMLVFVVA